MQVLVVDDSMVARNILKNVLGPLGYEVLQAANGQEALEILKNQPEQIELVLLDWNMPVLNGFETLKAIKKQKKCKHIRILMVSTESEDDFIDRALSAGADGYLAKPFTAEALAAKVASVVAPPK
ncbi:MAG: response regulator [Desulfobacteraceae bacterium]|nr:MAG: response regulator [Desulfobacteraceae bacterium]